jgi:TonB family protein
VSLAVHAALGLAVVAGAFESLSEPIVPREKTEHRTVQVALPRMEVQNPLPVSAPRKAVPIAPLARGDAADQDAPAPRPRAAETASPEPPAPPRGEAGRARARQEIAQSLGGLSGGLTQMLSDMSTTLSSAPAPAAAPSAEPASTRLAGSVRSARGSGEVGGVAQAGSRVGAQTGGSALGGGQVAIEEIIGGGGGSGSGGSGGGSRVGGRAGGGRAAGAGGAGVGGDARSNASLLAVVRKYSAGIQFCYENELKKAPGLGGRLVVAITVAAAGNVTEAAIVQDTVGSPALASCALAQIREWRFPVIPDGVVTFRTPFIFTPPD